MTFITIKKKILVSHISFVVCIIQNVHLFDTVYQRGPQIMLLDYDTEFIKTQFYPKIDLFICVKETSPLCSVLMSTKLKALRIKFISELLESNK